MNLPAARLFKNYMAEMDEKTRDARLFTDNLAFLGYAEEFQTWFAKVLAAVREHTPVDSAAQIEAGYAAEDIGSKLEFRFEPGIQHLCRALELSIDYASFIRISHLNEFKDACATIDVNPETVLSDLCWLGTEAIKSGASRGAQVTVQL